MIGEVIEFDGVKLCKSYDPTGVCNCFFHQEKYNYCLDKSFRNIVGDCIKGQYVFIKLDDLGLSVPSKEVEYEL